MLLVWYKREFEWSDVLRLWEALWTDFLSSQYHIFIAMAILEKHRDVLMEHLKHFDEVLKYFNELSGTIDLMDTLIRSEKLFKRFESMAAVAEKSKTSLPSREDVIRRNRAVIMGGPAMIAAGPTRMPPMARASASGRDVASITPTDDDGKEKSVISPELRGLLFKDRAP